MNLSFASKLFMCYGLLFSSKVFKPVAFPVVMANSEDVADIIKQVFLTPEQQEAILQYIERRGETQKAVAERMHMSRGYLCNLLNGKKNLSQRNAARIYDALGRGEEVEFLLAFTKSTERFRHVQRFVQFTGDYAEGKSTITYRYQTECYNLAAAELCKVFSRGTSEQRQELLGELESLIAKYKG